MKSLIATKSLTPSECMGVLSGKVGRGTWVNGVARAFPGGRARPPGRPTWGRKWRKFEKKWENLQENEERLKKCSKFAHPGVKGWLRPWRGCAAQPFRPLMFTNGPFFYLKIGLDIGRVFTKCLNFDEFFLWFTCRLSKSTDASQFTW